MIAPLRNTQLAVETAGYIHRDLFRWLNLVAKGVNQSALPGEIRTVKLSSDDVSDNFDASGLGIVDGTYDGWAICNGNNDTPSLSGLFLRFAVTAAGGTGGSDSSAHTHSTPAHAHQTEFGWDGTNWFAKTTAIGNPASGSVVEAGVDSLNPAHGDVVASDAVRLAKTRTDGSSTTGAASVTDNRPAYYELVPLMRVG